MQFFRLSPASCYTVARLLENGAPRIDDKLWSTYPGGEMFDGEPLHGFDRVTLDAVRAAVVLAEATGRIVVMVPANMPSFGGLSPSITAGFTVVLDMTQESPHSEPGGEQLGVLRAFQVVISIDSKMVNSLADEVITTPSASFMLRSLRHVSAWDMTIPDGRNSHENIGDLMDNN